MEILACPIDKHYPLELHVFEEKEEITEGLLVCPQCDRWYPISDEIPQMLPDDLREAKDDLEWLHRWKAQVPHRVLTEGKPFRLGEVLLDSTPMKSQARRTRKPSLSL